MMTDGMLQRKYQMLAGLLDERALRLCLAADALTMKYGGISQVARASGLSRTTIHAGIEELKNQSADHPQQSDMAPKPPAKIRRSGAGRKPLKDRDAAVLVDLDRLLNPVTRGDPMSALQWTCKSTSKLTGELRKMGHRISQPTVWRLLDELGYSMQSNRKTREGGNHPDRNAQFEFITTTVNDFLARGLPVVSVDTKKKELIGTYKNGGREWEKKGQPVGVDVYDFVNEALGKGIPYGVFDIGRNEGWVSVGVTHDTAEFAVATIHRWWLRMGKSVYPDAKELLITADGGGSNGSRVRLWKRELQRLADQTSMTIHVRHFPPGTSKWNKIEHRMFCHITENWRSRPLTSRMMIVNLISNTKTRAGLSIQAELDEANYETGTKVTDEEMAMLPIGRCEFHGEWNYHLKPSTNKPY